MSWNLSLDEERSLESVARGEVLLSQEGLDGLPRTPEEAAKFNPPAWVLEAMRRAFVLGRLSGGQKARADIRAALGIRD